MKMICATASRRCSAFPAPDGTYHTGQTKIDDEIDQERGTKEDKHIGDVDRSPVKPVDPGAVIVVGLGNQQLGAAHQLNGDKAGHIAGVLDGGDHLAEQGRNDVPVRLGQNDQRHGADHPKALGIRSLKLSPRNSVQTAADDLCHHG